MERVLVLTHLFVSRTSRRRDAGCCVGGTQGVHRCQRGGEETGSRLERRGTRVRSADLPASPPGLPSVPAKPSSPAGKPTARAHSLDCKPRWPRPRSAHCPPQPPKSPGAELPEGSRVFRTDQARRGRTSQERGLAAAQAGSPLGARLKEQGSLPGPWRELLGALGETRGFF